VEWVEKAKVVETRCGWSVIGVTENLCLQKRRHEQEYRKGSSETKETRRKIKRRKGVGGRNGNKKGETHHSSRGLGERRVRSDGVNLGLLGCTLLEDLRHLGGDGPHIKDRVRVAMGGGCRVVKEMKKK